MKVRTGEVIIYSVGKEKNAEYTYKFPDTRIDFKISQVDTDAPDACFVKIYGVSRETYGVFKPTGKGEYDKNYRVDITYGYDNDNEVVYSGTVTRVTYAFEYGAQVMTILLSHDFEKFSKVDKTVSTNEKTTIGEAMSILGEKYGYRVTFADDVNTSVVVGRISYTGALRESISGVLPSKYKYYIDEHKIHVFYKKKYIQREITLCMDNGLLSFPTEDTDQEKFRIKSILIPFVESGMIVKVPIDDNWYSLVDTKRYRSFVVGNYTSTFSNNLGTTEMECSEL